MLPNKHLIIAIDFDGTIVEDAYPRIGTPMLFAFETIKKLQSEGHRLILWTYRSGQKLEEAVAFCKENDMSSAALTIDDFESNIPFFVKYFFKCSTLRISFTDYS